jgi:glycosyltransferase involved in cell wall biosynthesis
MPKITAVLHTTNDALRLGRALESLRPCDEFIVLDHSSSDATVAVAQEYGAIVKTGSSEAAATVLASARNDWIFSLLPSEVLSEALEASLFEWTLSEHDPAATFGVSMRQELLNGWESLPPATRLLNRTSRPWVGKLPPEHPQTQVLEGDLLRLRDP